MTTDSHTRPSTDWAHPGTLVMYRSTLYKVTKNNRVNLQVVDEDGKTWNLRKHPTVTYAPEGTVWSGPEKSQKEERHEARIEQRAIAAAAFSPGDTVEMKSATDRARFPGVYVLVKETTVGRFKLQRIGQPGGLTSPATRIQKREVVL